MGRHETCRAVRDSCLEANDANGYLESFLFDLVHGFMSVCCCCAEISVPLHVRWFQILPRPTLQSVLHPTNTSSVLNLWVHVLSCNFVVTPVLYSSNPA